MNDLNLFQWFALSLFLTLLVVEFVQLIRGHVKRRFLLLRVLIWITAGMAIYQPALPTKLAQFLGIERGADLVLYIAVLFFLGISLFLYARCLRLQQQITQIVRFLAIHDAQEPNRPEG
ncbi:MAG: DUF2304 domain-containing protein [Planctomycetales bacterium]